MTDTQATDVVTFDFESTGVRCVVCGTSDYEMNFFLMHTVAKCSWFVMIVRVECGHTCGIDRHKRQADRTLLFEYNYMPLIVPFICRIICMPYSIKNKSDIF